MNMLRCWLGMTVLAAGMLVAAPDGATEKGHSHVVALRHGEFVPAEVEVEVGETVLWRHEDGDDPQSVTADDGSFDSHPDCTKNVPGRCMQGGDTFSHTFERTGRVPYHSRTEAMSGVVVVVEGHPWG